MDDQFRQKLETNHPSRFDRFRLLSPVRKAEMKRE
jgi:hypothetical protein